MAVAARRSRALIGVVVPIGVFVMCRRSRPRPSAFTRRCGSPPRGGRDGLGDRGIDPGRTIAATGGRPPNGSSPSSRMSKKMPTTSSARAADPPAIPGLHLNQGTKTVDPLIIPIVGILMPLVLVPTVLVLKHRYKRREWEHLERMKAMSGRNPSRGWAGRVGREASPRSGPASRSPSVLGALVTTPQLAAEHVRRCLGPRHRLGMCRADQRGGLAHEPPAGALAGPDAATARFSRVGRPRTRQAGFRPGHVRRGGEPRLNRPDEPGRASIAIIPRRPRSPSSARSGCGIGPRRS